jgi:hypothetical protein
MSKIEKFAPYFAGGMNGEPSRRAINPSTDYSSSSTGSAVFFPIHANERAPMYCTTR